MNTRYCLTLDLKNDQSLIQEYEAHHRKVWPEVLKSIADSGVSLMEIYRFETRLFMIMETGPDFSFEEKARKDSMNPMVQKWEELMLHYQQPIKPALKTDKWVLMSKIFQL